MILGDPLNCAQYELRSAILHLLTSAPAPAKAGQVWFNTGSTFPFYYNGITSRPMDAAGLTDGSIQNSALQTNPLLRANHTGSQPASTISNLQTTVTAYTLDTFAPPVSTMNANGQRYTNAAQAVQSTDFPTWGQTQNYVQSAIQGQVAIKDPVRLCIAQNVNLSSPGALLDGTVSANVGDRLLLIAQTTATQNNIYIYNGTSSALTVAADCASGSQWAGGTEVLVDAGAAGSTYDGAVFRQTTSGTIVLGTNPLVFTQTLKINVYSPDGTTTALTGYTFSVKYDATTMTTTSGSLGARTDVFARKYSTSFTTDGASNAFNINHTLSTTNVIVGVRDSNGNKVFLDDNPASSSAVTITFGSVPPQGLTYSVTILG